MKIIKTVPFYILSYILPGAAEKTKRKAGVGADACFIAG